MKINYSPKAENRLKPTDIGIIKNRIDIKIYSREGTMFSGPIKSISSFNSLGRFDILLDHANFVSPIEKSVLIDVGGGVVKEINLKRGILRAKSNKVEIYLGL